MEEWKDIIYERDGVIYDYTGLYEVSNKGRIRNKDGKILKLHKVKEHDYLTVGLYKNKKQKYYSVHRLVAYAFIPNPEKLPEINHKDENKQNNTVENLEWCDRIYNINYGTGRKRQAEKLKGKKSGMYGHKHKEQSKKAIGEKQRGQLNHHSRKVVCLQNGMIFNTVKEAVEYAEKVTGKNCNVSSCCRGKSKYAGIDLTSGEKLCWMYYEDYLKLQEKKG